MSSRPSSPLIPADESFMAAFREKIVSGRVPVEGTWSLTARCNLRCIHCYLGKSGSLAHGCAELNLAEIRVILDQLTAAGTLFLTLTGGEPLLHPDFPEIYREAVGHGMIVTVFSNGTTIDTSAVGLFRELPPHEVEITVPGCTRETYEGITGVPGSHEGCLAGIARLREAKVRFSLKTVLMRGNAHELEGLEEMAHRLSVPYRYDAALFPSLRDRGPVDSTNAAYVRLRLSPEEVSIIDAATDDRRRRWRQAFENGKGRSYPRRVYLCGAGLTDFHIDPWGFLTPCVVSARIRHDLRAGSFLDGWNGPLAAIRERETRAGFACDSCDVRNVCTGCPALFELEGGEPDIVSPYLCRTAHERYNALQAVLSDSSDGRRA